MKIIIFTLILSLLKGYSEENPYPMEYSYGGGSIPHERQSKFYGLDFLLKKTEFKNLNFIESYELLKANSSYKNLFKREQYILKGIEFDKSVNLNSSKLKLKKSSKFLKDTPFILVLETLALRYGLIPYYSQGYLYIGSIEEHPRTFTITPTIKDYLNKRLSSLEDIEKHLLKLCHPSYLNCTISKNKKSIMVDGADLNLRQIEAYFFLIESSNLKDMEKKNVEKNSKLKVLNTQ